MLRGENRSKTLRENSVIWCIPLNSKYIALVEKLFLAEVLGINQENRFVWSQMKWALTENVNFLQASDEDLQEEPFTGLTSGSLEKRHVFSHRGDKYANNNETA